MGSYYSTACNKFVQEKLPTTSTLFSDFCENIKHSCRKDKVLADRFKSNLNYPLECDVETMETIVQLWCINCLSTAKWQNFNRTLKNQLIHDFLNTLYCTSHAFDEIFLLLFTNAKSRSFIFENSGELASSGIRSIVKEVLQYSSCAGLKYVSHSKGQKRLENIVDFPLKTFSLCPCTRRPLYVAMYLSRPDVVQLLLKCGARIPYEDVCRCMEDSRHPLQNVMDILKVTCDSKADEILIKSQADRAKRNILSLKLVLVDLKHHTALWINICDTLKCLSGTENVSIPSLKHICRTQIRQNMRNSPFFNHPHVWKILCLPQTLISYMSLDDFYEIKIEN